VQWVVRSLSSIGKTQADLPPEVNYIRGERSTYRHKGEFKRLAPQVVLDMIPYTEQDALATMNTFEALPSALSSSAAWMCME